VASPVFDPSAFDPEQFGGEGELFDGEVFDPTAFDSGGEEGPSNFSGGASAAVGIAAAGAGTAAEQASGGALAVVQIAATGAGTALESASGGAGAVIQISAAGEGFGPSTQERDGGGGGSGRPRKRAALMYDEGRKVFFFDTQADKREAEEAAREAVRKAMEGPAKPRKPAQVAAVAEPVIARFAAEVVDMPSLQQFAVDTGQQEAFARAAQSRHYQELLQLFHAMRQAAEDAEEEEIEMLLLAEYA